METVCGCAGVAKSVLAVLVVDTHDMVWALCVGVRIMCLLYLTNCKIVNKLIIMKTLPLDTLSYDVAHITLTNEILTNHFDLFVRK